MGVLSSNYPEELRTRLAAPGATGRSTRIRPFVDLAQLVIMARILAAKATLYEFVACRSAWDGKSWCASYVYRAHLQRGSACTCSTDGLSCMHPSGVQKQFADRHPCYR